MNKPPRQGNPSSEAGWDLARAPGPASLAGLVTGLYFAYGSNLRAAHMARLCPGNEFLGPARLEGHRLAFTWPDEEWRGGVADVVPSPGDAVWGALYRMQEADWPALDAYEVFDPAGPEEHNEYVRRLVMVVPEKERRALEAWCYFVRAPREHIAPSERYRAALIEGALERELPAEYVSQMRRAFHGTVTRLA